MTKTKKMRFVAVLFALLFSTLCAAFVTNAFGKSTQTAYADGDYGLRRVTADMLQPVDGHPQAENFPDFRQTNPSQYDPLGRAKSLETGKKCFVISKIYTWEFDMTDRFCYDVYENGNLGDNLAGCNEPNSFILGYVNDPDYLVYYTSTPVHSHNAIDLFEEWTSDDSLPTVAGDYYLAQDVTPNWYWTVPSGTTNLCLNGHYINFQGDKGVIIEEGAMLNIYDCGTSTRYITMEESGISVSNTDSNGAIPVTGGFIAGSKNTAFDVKNNGTLNLYSGTICCNKYGVYLNGHPGAFNMYGGKISYNQRGVDVRLGKFTMEDGTISHNDGNANYNGAGVHVNSSLSSTTSCAFEMNGGVIEYNTTKKNGGGVYVQKGVFTMNDGLIRNNEADYGGGVYLAYNNPAGTFLMNGGTISNNTAVKNGGGVAAIRNITLSGDVAINNNTLSTGNLANNLYFGQNARIDFNKDHPMTTETSIGVSMEIFGEFTNNYGKDNKHFTSEDPTYAVYTNQYGQLYLSFAHEHSLTYTVSGATITATCSVEGCPLTDGKATLTINAPTGDMVYDGNARVATLSAYDASVFAPEAIKYYKGDQEVASCIAAGTYFVKVTSNGATATVTFTIENWTLNDDSDPDAPEKQDVTVEINGAEVDESVQLKVEVKAEIATEEAQGDYTEAVKEKITEKEEVAIVYEVKLLRLTVVGGQETLEEIQPSEIKEGATLTITMKIPEELKGKDFRVLHIHNAGDVSEVHYTLSASGDYISVETDRLSEFAFLVEKADTGNETVEGKHGFCIGWVVFIFVMLLILYTALYLIVWLPQTAKFAAKCKLDIIKKQREKVVLFGFVNLLLLVGLCASCAIWIFALVALCVHVCPVTVVSFVLVTLILVFYGLILWCEWAKDKKYNTKKSVTSDKK